MIYVAIPTRDNRLHAPCVAGLLGLAAAGIDARIDIQSVGDISTVRDIMTRKFLASGATHMLSLDSDLAWGPQDLLRLLAHDLPAVCGIYTRRDGSRTLPFQFSDPTAPFGGLLSLEAGGMGFMLLERAAVARVWAHHAVTRTYHHARAGELVGLWSPIFDSARGLVDDSIAFCQRWLSAGKLLCADTGVVLPHYGEVAHVP